jgi:hypothetical protein
MKFTKIISFLGLFFIGLIQVVSQPFTLDKNIKPVELKLQKDTRKGHEGELFIATISSVDATKYYYVSGHSLFQDIDVIVTDFSNSENLEVELVNNSWGDVIKKQSTDNAENGIVNFKIRSLNKFGIKVTSPSGENLRFTIAVHANPEQKNYLETPFSKISKAEMQVKTSSTTNGVTVDDPSDNNEGGSNTLLYILLGVAILIIGVLAGKLMGKKSASVVLLCLTSSLTVHAQRLQPDRFYGPDDYESYMDDTEEEMKTSPVSEKSFGDNPMDDFDSAQEKFDKFKDTFEKYKDYKEKYDNLTDCMKTGPIPGEPRIPSFCDIPVSNTGWETDKSCAGCFKEARRNFNETRYLFTQLATIYRCTKNFSEAAIAYGDNVSGYHGVSGMAWQTQKVNIEKSVTDLQKAYDNKYNELVRSLHNNMIALSECEARYGVDDWYDRFGYIYFEFIRDKYKRID